MPEKFDIRMPLSGQKKLYICGHRGDRTGTDENTMAAFRRAGMINSDDPPVHMKLFADILTPVESPRFI